MNFQCDWVSSKLIECMSDVLVGAEHPHRVQENSGTACWVYCSDIICQK